MKSPAQLAMDRLAEAIGPLAHDALDAILDKLTFDELVMVASDWRHFWARPAQVPPDTSWQSWGHFGGRGLGKTIACGKHVNEEVEAGRAPLVVLAAQDEANTVAIQVLGPSGVIATAPPWFKPTFEASKLEVVWPNGARAYVRTPEVPGKIRGLEYHLAWLTEIQSWPTKTREEAFYNALISTRLGYARVLWDATPKRGHPLLKRLLANAEKDPTKHVIVRGGTRDNAANLGDGYIAKLEAEIGGTQRGREELDGEQLDESESALFRQDWIDRNRCDPPRSFRRRVVSVDPAVTDRHGSDLTGIIDAGLMDDGRAIVMADRTGRHAAHEWGAIVLDLYTAGDCDLVIVETNKGGNLLTQNLRACAKERGLRVVVVDAKWIPRREAGKVFVREIYSKGSKSDRAQPTATAYERNRVAHSFAADLVALEEVMTTWEPEAGSRSPDRLDALVGAIWELLSLSNDGRDPSRGFVGVLEFADALKRGSGAPNVGPIPGRGGRTI